MAYVAELGYLDGHDHAMVDEDRVIQSIEGMERACFQEANRLVRIRMLGGVAGVRSNAAPMPIASHTDKGKIMRSQFTIFRSIQNVC